MDGGSSTGVRGGPPRQQRQAQGRQQQQGSAKQRGLPHDPPEVRLSKSISWVLRHGAQQEGLALRADGYARVQDMLNLPKFKTLDLDTLQKIVADDKKTRFKLIYERDQESSAFAPPEWWIRANQGHTMKSVAVEVSPIKAVSDIPSKVAVHGTTLAAWEIIKREGLSKMKRNHVHLAQGLPGTGVVSGMRHSSKVFIFVDVQKALDAGINFYLSSNGVVLSDGDESGYIRPRFFEQVKHANGSIITGWQPSPAVAASTSAEHASGSAVAELQKQTANLAL